MVLQDESDIYSGMLEAINQYERDYVGDHNRIFYLALPPAVYPQVDPSIPLFAFHHK